LIFIIFDCYSFNIFQNKGQNGENLSFCFEFCHILKNILQNTKNFYKGIDFRRDLFYNKLVKIFY